MAPFAQVNHSADAAAEGGSVENARVECVSTLEPSRERRQKRTRAAYSVAGESETVRVFDVKTKFHDGGARRRTYPVEEHPGAIMDALIRKIGDDDDFDIQSDADDDQVESPAMRSDRVESASNEEEEELASPQQMMLLKMLLGSF